MQISIRDLTGKTLHLDIASDETILSIRQKIYEQNHAWPPQRTLLIYGGKVLEDHVALTGEPKRIIEYNILEGASLHVLLRAPGVCNEDFAQLPSDESAVAAQRTWQNRAEEFDCDDDLHILDPSSHFHLLEQLKARVVQRSEYHRQARSYNVWDARVYGLYSLANQAQPREDDLPEWLGAQIVQSAPNWIHSQDKETFLYDLSHFLKSYGIVYRALESMRDMQNRSFCRDSINFLCQHKLREVVELKHIEIVQVEILENGMAALTRNILANFVEHAFTTDLVTAAGFCQTFLKTIGCEESQVISDSRETRLTFTRKTALLLDNAVLSYVQSHGEDSEADQESLEVSSGLDSVRFSCSLHNLACLSGFLDYKRVWVFNISGALSLGRSSDSEAKVSLHLLTRMRDLADIWGPVYAVPSSTGCVVRYRVSKGFIARVKLSSNSPNVGTFQCHYFPRPFFEDLLTSRRPPECEDLPFSWDDFALIGGGLRCNNDCQTGLSDYVKDLPSKLRPLGTREAVWQTESRSISVGISKYIGLTVSGTQKLIPRTTLKQHIFDKWSKNPSRSNPGILNQYLGVEISHCTGNARRISLRKVLDSSTICSVLDLHSPVWKTTCWGAALDAALRDADEDAIFRIWKDFAPNRVDIAELCCCMFDLLDCTGHDKYQLWAGFIHNNEEAAVAIANGINDWSVTLADSPLKSAYVFINQICLNCDFPENSPSTCFNNESYTVLETEFAVNDKFGISGMKWSFVLQPHGLRLKQVDCGKSDALMLTRDIRSFLDKVSHVELLEIFELCNRTRSVTRAPAYIRADKLSFRGRRAIERPSTSHHIGRIFGPRSHSRNEVQTAQSRRNLLLSSRLRRGYATGSGRQSSAALSTTAANTASWTALGALAARATQAAPQLQPNDHAGINLSDIYGSNPHLVRRPARMGNGSTAKSNLNENSWTGESGNEAEQQSSELRRATRPIDNLVTAYPENQRAVDLSRKNERSDEAHRRNDSSSTTLPVPTTLPVRLGKAPSNKYEPV